MSNRSYHVTYSQEAARQIAKLDGGVRVIILKWIKKHLEGTDNPRTIGKGLVGELTGLWRYRVGDYRLLCQIKDAVIEVEIVKIGHRREVYVFNQHGGRKRRK
jgi:mRNA interferase RelE/StbE